MGRDTGRSGWSEVDVGNQSGRVAVVTGASSGVGFQVASVLAGSGARVVLACRDLEKGRAAVSRIAATHPGAELHLVHLDLSSLRSVRAAAEEIRETWPAIDLLVDNAGVMWAPHQVTEDGFELHLGTNHLGHFALTGLVLDRLLAAPGSRVVLVSSPAHRQADVNDLDDLVDLENLAGTRGYDRADAYARSKLANLLHAYELHRRLADASAPTIALAAHPGAARTELNRHLPRLFRGPSWGLSRPLTHSPEKGALPLLMAALDTGLTGGEYVAPSGIREFKGRPECRTSSDVSHDRDLQRRLWRVSEQLTGVTYDFTARPPAAGREPL
ncbi:MAG: SDR family NAD(P)-dependent oxidoreductase [Nocardioides sp.]|nr:SDR family NAD(P)-dependent oxidoreductase [Nocardioides sp.]